MPIKPIKALKMVLCILMSLLIILNCSIIELTGVLVHIISGIILCLLSFVHVFLSRQYFLASCKDFFRPQLKMKTRINLMIDFILIFLIMIITITGIMLANDLIPKGFGERPDFVGLHSLLALSLFLLLVVHICLHVFETKDAEKRNYP